MNILVIADPHISVPPRHYGGTERIVTFFCEAMHERKHCVHLLAGPRSASYGGQVITHHAPSPARRSRIFRKVWFQIMSLWAAHNVDVVVNFGRLDYLWALLKIQIPILCRFGNPVTQSQLDWILAQRRLGVRFIGISKHQMAGLVPQELIDIVHNGTDVQKFQFSDGPQIKPYLAFLGRITPNKGADTAIRVARSSGMKLKIAGNISDEKGGREFFEQTIKPQLGSHIEWLGPVDDMAKQRLLGNASALLFPIRWPEPFGIVMAESLACGTPILATRCASTPEVIDHGVTGFLCDSEGDMVAAVKQLPTIDRSTCRRVAEERFSVPIMAQGYLDAIERLMRDGSKAKMLAV